MEELFLEGLGDVDKLSFGFREHLERRSVICRGKGFLVLQGFEAFLVNKAERCSLRRTNIFLIKIQILTVGLGHLVHRMGGLYIIGLQHSAWAKKHKQVPPFEI